MAFLLNLYADREPQIIYGTTKQIALQALNGGIVMANFMDAYINDDPDAASVWDVVSKFWEYVVRLEHDCFFFL